MESYRKVIAFLIVFITAFHVFGAEKFRYQKNAYPKDLISSKSGQNLYFSVGIAGGIFFPVEVNNYITDYLDDNDIYVTSGSAELIYNYSLNIGLRYPVNNYVGTELIAEGALSYKLLLVNNAPNESFLYTRYSGGIMPYVNVFKNNDNVGYLGAGVLYSVMDFMRFNTGSLGYRFQAGVDMHQQKTIYGVFIGFDWIKGTASGTWDNIELSYSTVRAGARMDFGIF